MLFLRTENRELRTLGYEDKPSRLFSHHFYEHAFVAPPVEFGVENLLPGTEVELAAGHRDDDFVVNDQRFQMRVSVVLTGLVMPVVLPEGRELFQPLVDVVDKSALVIVDINPGGDVHGGDQDHPVFNSRLPEGALNLRRQ